MQELPSRHAGNLPLLREATAEPTAFNLLVRLFLFGLAQPVGVVSAAFPADVVAFLIETGMAAERDGEFVPLVMLRTTKEYVVAADPAYRMHPEPAPDLILWPNQTTELLQNFSLREPCGATLDFGAGCGVISVFAAPFSERVVATDLNPRTAEFVEFNSWLNGSGNIECRIGDGFEPVADRTFDRILANPPFFVTPSSGVLYCENPLELDGFCRRVAREGAQHLNEGGFLQMTLEWVQVKGQAWQERLAEWADSTGCDLWVLRTYAGPPTAYAHQRYRDLYAESPERATEKFEQGIAYYRERQVEEVHGGLLALRRRSGRNWMRFEEGRVQPGHAFGDLIRDLFATQDVLSAGLDAEGWMAVRPRLCDAARIEQQLSISGGHWVRNSFKLYLDHSLPGSLAIDPQIADFLAMCDGRRPLGELAGELATKVRADPGQVRTECVSVVRRLAEKRFLSLADATAVP